LDYFIFRSTCHRPISWCHYEGGLGGSWWASPHCYRSSRSASGLLNHLRLVTLRLWLVTLNS